ncbi:MAG: colanic acid biosynthesis glycosyltransferase WcaL, partial [Actinomycetota bacterium]|nr:colanic acid biosynthesis glycosyltransferase WcaL [Actinomycetota bacterium]
MSPAEEGTASGRVAYVLKMYPRFSETFIVNELLAHQAAGVAVDIMSLRPPLDGRFHESLAAVDACVTYLPHSGFSARGVWEALRDVASHLPDAPTVTDSVIHELLTTDVQDAMQAIALAELVRTRGVTHLHAHFGSVATTVARLAGRLAGVPYTFTAHAKDIFHNSVEPEDLRTKL